MLTLLFDLPDYMSVEGGVEIPDGIITGNPACENGSYILLNS